MPINVRKAELRLESAREALEEMRGPVRDMAHLERIWHRFLVEASGVYEQIKAACKPSPQDRQWFGEKENIRKNDSLLQYVYQARHSDLHTLATVVSKGPRFTIRVKQGGTVDFDFEKRMPFIRYNDGTIQYADPPTYRAMLLPVTGRGDVRFLPPTTFMGQPLEDNGPLTVGQLAIDYLSALVEEARGRS